MRMMSSITLEQQPYTAAKEQAVVAQQTQHQRLHADIARGRPQLAQEHICRQRDCILHAPHGRRVGYWGSCGI
jgi:hypothetical protein